MFNQPLRILMIGPYPLEEGKIVGGVEAVTNTLAHSLSGHPEVEKVGVLSFRRGQNEVQHRPVNPKLEVWFVPAQDRLNVLTQQILERWRAQKLVETFRPTVTHGQGIGGSGEIAAALNPASVATVHGLQAAETLLEGQSLSKKIRSFLVAHRTKRVLKKAKVIISISQYDAHTLKPFIAGQQISIFNPINPEFFIPFSPPTPQPKLLFAGTHVQRKNLAGILRAFSYVLRNHPQATLTCVGPQLEPAYMKTLSNLVQELGLGQAVSFLGLVNNQQLQEQVKSCQALVMFSDEETAPTIIAQAMAMGKPVVSSNVGGIAEMVQEGETGFLVPAQDELALTRQLNTLLSRPELAGQMGYKAHLVARQKFEPQAVTQQTISAYRLAQQLSLAT